ncbi:hypothetical protein SKAU_G00389060 [Synaphobranchus kaupii]|uniref:Uncharacterized protein n=1 Tax=Synaphobranchus kaupii TaxID=118154 RepID=A0A9Q1IDE1_SYNKA|nr:hypothetical protein SKAU_G00389060 [Synaphobranchus kaupii]
MQCLARYTTQCIDFQNGPSLLPVNFQEPTVVPSVKWLLTVYSQDILTRLDDTKARITSTYGSILKLDSTRRITKKLAGTANGTAMWLTSVGNELGQVLISVLMAQEGAGLDLMADGLVMREELALHCRRRTNGEETTIRLLEQLLQELAGSSGNDSLGLIDTEWMEYIWHVQRKHVKCIQDPPGVALYTEMGRMTKGGKWSPHSVSLPITLNMHRDSEETAVLIEELDVEEDREGDEGLCDLTEDPTVLDVEVL